ncbi:MAG: T9SS type B sorting domain-containing protein [Crocinitomicaceae bacterium]
MKRFLLLILFFSRNFICHSQEVTYIQSPQNAFIENKGQWDEKVFFKAKTENGNLWIQDRKFLFHIQDFSFLHDNHGKTNLNSKLIKDNQPGNIQSVVHLNFLNANQFKLPYKENQTQHYFNYLIGNDQSRWTYDVHGYSSALFSNIYDGIDLKLIENNGNLKYEFIVKPQQSYNQIQLQLVGQDDVFIGKNGDLHIKTIAGEIIEEAPYTYQIINGKIIPIKSSFQLSERNVISFKIGNYNRNEALIIDPTLVFATYSGSITDNFGMTGTYAHNGDGFSGGIVFGNQYPTPDKDAYDVNSNFTVNSGSYGITDVFISRFSSDGTQMLWTTFIGGGNNSQGSETVHSLISDKNDNLFFFGATSSTDFPIVNGFQTNHSGGNPGANFTANGVYHLTQGTDLFVAKVSSNGHQLLGSTYIGGSDNDGVNYNATLSYDSLMTNYGDNSRGEVMLDENENCIIASCTRSTNFPTINPFQIYNRGDQDGVIFKLSNDLSSLIWSSYFGGSKNDVCNSVKVDSSYNIVFAGGTSSNNLLNTAGAWKPSFQGGTCDGFVAKVSNDGQTLIQTSYVGENDYDQTFFVEIDENDNIFLYGQSKGGNFPVVNANFFNANSGQYICKLSSDLKTLQKSTVFGNSNLDLNISPSAFLVDRCGNIYVSGWGSSLFSGIGLSGMPTTPNALYSSAPNGHDFYLMVMNKDFDDLIYGSYIGGNLSDEHVDGGTSRFDRSGKVYQSVCAGCGNNSDFPTTPNAWSNLNLSDNCNNILFKYDFSLVPSSNFDVSYESSCTNSTFTFQNNSTIYNEFLWDFGNNDTTSTDLNPIRTFDTAGIYNIKLYITETNCNLTDSFEIILQIYDSIQASNIDSTYFLCDANSILLTPNSFGSAKNFIWSTSNQFIDTLNSSTLDSVLNYIPNLGPQQLFLKYQNGDCFQVDSTLIILEDHNYDIEGSLIICPPGDTTKVSIVNKNPDINYTYLWSNKNDIIGNDTLSFANYNLTYDKYAVVKLTSQNGCVIKDSALIQVGYLDTNLVLITASDTLIPYNTSIELEANPFGFTYQWEPSNLVENNQTISTQSLNLKSDTEFILKVKDGPCEKSDTILVKVFEFVCGDPSIFIPNAFSPNGDGNNDLVYVRGQMIDELLFRVYDRWGNLIFETTERSIGWDGTYKGKKCAPDVYDYYLKVKCIDQIETEIKGNITLLN